MRNIAIQVSISLAFLISSCGSGSGNPFSKLGSSNDSCSLQIDQSTWEVTSSPNQTIFPITNNYASVQASTANCGTMFSGSNNISISVNFTSSLVGYPGQQLALVSFSVGAKSLVESDTSNNFVSGKLQGIAVTSQTNSNWKPPFSDPGFMVLTFQIPASSLGVISSYPSGLIYVDQIN